MNKKTSSKRTLNMRGPASTVLAAVMCIIIGVIIGYVALLLINPENAWNKGLLRILKGGFYDMPYGVGRVLSYGAALIMTGLSVAFAFKTGLFNIGAAGQYTVGAFGGILFAIVLKAPWWVCLLASTLFGAVWGAIPGFFKAFLNINEVISSIMFNWIGLYVVNDILYGKGVGPMFDSYTTKTYALSTAAPDALIPDLGLAKLFGQKSTTIAIFLAIAAAIAVYVVLNKTTFGYELKACGFNREAARYAGINEKKNIILSMTIAGALAGFGAGLYYLSGCAEWQPLNSNALPAMGFNGISVALLASSDPIGCVLAGLFISHITIGGTYLPNSIYPTEIASLISGIIIYLCAFSMLFKNQIIRLINKIFGSPDADANAEDEEPAPQPIAENSNEGGTEK